MKPKTNITPETSGLFWAVMASLAFWCAAVALILICTSCTLTVSPDGSRTWGMNATETARAIVILSDK